MPASGSSTVTICRLSGDEIILHKKHSPRFQLAAALPEAFDKYQDGALQLTRDIDDLKGTLCSHVDAKEMIYDIFRRRLVPLRLFHPVVAVLAHAAA